MAVFRDSAQDFADPYQGLANKSLLNLVAKAIEDIDRNGCGISDLGWRNIKPIFPGNWREHGSEPFDYLVTFDLCLLALEYIRLANLKLVSGFSENEDKVEFARIQCAGSLIEFILLHAKAIRLLVFDGLDTPGRALTRSVIEGCDLLIVTESDPEVAKAFMKSGEDFNKFWHGYMTKGKLSKKKRHVLIKFWGYDTDQVNAIEDSQAAEFDMFSRAVHPSFAAGLVQSVANLPPAVRVANGWNFLQHWQSQRTMQLAVQSIGSACNNWMLSKRSSQKIVGHLDARVAGSNNKEIMQAFINVLSALVKHLYDQQLAKRRSRTENKP